MTLNVSTRTTLAAPAVWLFVVASTLLWLPASTAHAEPITTSYVDRLGCGSSDATVTPVFGWAGSGSAASGASYTASTDASSYPPVTGVFSAASGSPTYTTYSPTGYGSDFQYRGTGGLGFPSVVQGKNSTLTMQLPHAQAVQFTVGGMQQPTRVVISASGPGGPVAPSVAARSGAANSATATVVGGEAQLTGAVMANPADGGPEAAVDVWFAQPVDSISIRLAPTGTGEDAGFIVTAPIACQAGSTTTTASTGTPSVAADGVATYEVALSTTVQNTSSTTGAVLYPQLTMPLRAQLEAQGMSLASVSAISASSAACNLNPAYDGSNALVSSGAGPLAPGESCTLDWIATVSMPQSAQDRTVDVAATLSSSSTASARIKDQQPATVTFPGITSALSATDSGAAQAQPGQTVSRSVTVTNAGPAAALSSTYSVVVPGGTSLAGIPASCSLSGDTMTCSLGNLGPGESIALNYQLVVTSSVAPGTELPIAAAAASSSQADQARSDYSVAIVAPPPTPSPSPAPPSPVPPPSQPPSPAPEQPAPDAPTESRRDTPAEPPQQSVPPESAPSPAPSDEEDSDDGGAQVVSFNLSIAGGQLFPGTVSTFRGQLGPVPFAISDVSVSGSVNAGVLYRSVRVVMEGEPSDCESAQRTFTCSITLVAGQTAQLEIRLFTDALNAPDQAVQQLAVTAPDGSKNTKTITTSISKTDTKADTENWTSAFALQMGSLPGAFLPITALLLLALAAVAEEKRRH